MTQFDLFTAAAVAPELPAAIDPPAEDLRQRLAARHGLWVDPFTAEYLARAVKRGVLIVDFIAADARTGRSAFHALPLAALRAV